MFDTMKKTAVAVLIVLIAVGCGTHRLKQAQDSFNEAARVESQVSYEDKEPTIEPLKGDTQALGNYRVALALTDEAIDKYPEELKADQLLGTALMLKALCQWRIAALDRNVDETKVRQLVDAINARITDENVVLGTRDKVLLQALPGLQEHALGLQAEPEQAQKLFESALISLENALTSVNPPPDHPVRVYIRLAQMRTLRAWRWVAYPDRPKDPDQLEAWHKAWNDKYVVYRQKLEPFMEANRGLRMIVEKMDEDFGYSP